MQREDDVNSRRKRRTTLGKRTTTTKSGSCVLLVREMHSIRFACVMQGYPETPNAPVIFDLVKRNFWMFHLLSAKVSDYVLFGDSRL